MVNTFRFDSIIILSNVLMQINVITHYWIIFFFILYTRYTDRFRIITICMLLNNKTNFRYIFVNYYFYYYIGKKIEEYFMQIIWNYDVLKNKKNSIGRSFLNDFLKKFRYFTRHMSHSFFLCVSHVYFQFQLNFQNRKRNKYFMSQPNFSH